MRSTLALTLILAAAAGCNDRSMAIYPTGSSTVYVVNNDEGTVTVDNSDNSDNSTENNGGE